MTQTPSASSGSGETPVPTGNTEIERKAANAELAILFMNELLDSVETLGDIALIHGQRTLVDLFYLHAAILEGGFIDHFRPDSCVDEVCRALPSASKWLRFVRSLDLDAGSTLATAVQPGPSTTEKRQYRVGVDRTGYRSCTVLVMAHSPEEAKHMALDGAGDKDFAGEHDATYSVGFVELDNATPVLTA